MEIAVINGRAYAPWLIARKITTISDRGAGAEVHFDDGRILLSKFSASDLHKMVCDFSKIEPFLAEYDRMETRKLVKPKPRKYIISGNYR